MNQASSSENPALVPATGEQDRTPKTARGEKTLAKLLAAAKSEFGDRGFHQTSISDITQAAGVALGTFYVYFESKDAIFRALVRYLGAETRAHLSAAVEPAPDRLRAEIMGLEAFIEFVRAGPTLYRTIEEAQFVAPETWRGHYSVFAEAYRHNLAAAAAAGQIRPGDDEVRAWALIGANVFIGMRYGVWDQSRSASDIAAHVGDLIANGLKPGP